MHFAFALFVAAAAVVATPTLAIKVLAISVAIYPILQIVKKMFPSISGPYAIGVNVCLAVVGLVVTVPAGDLLTLPTLLGLLTAAGTAAGIHGTVSALSPAPAPSTAAPVAAPPAQGGD